MMIIYNTRVSVVLTGKLPIVLYLIYYHSAFIRMASDLG